MMATINSVSINTIIQHSLNTKGVSLNTSSTDDEPVKPGLTELVEISTIAIEKQQQATQLSASKQIKEIAIDVVKVSSTIGKAQSSNNLTNNQATELYQKIAKLL